MSKPLSKYPNSCLVTWASKSDKVRKKYTVNSKKRKKNQ